MSEEKKGEEPLPTIDVKRVDARCGAANWVAAGGARVGHRCSLRRRPNMCPIESPLELEIDYTAASRIPGARWRVKYVVDTVHKRHEVDILSPPISLTARPIPRRAPVRSRCAPAIRIYYQYP